MKKRRSLFLIVLILPLFLWAGIMFETHAFPIKNYIITRSSLPREFSGYRIAFISDLHIGKFTKLGTLDRIVSRLEKQNLDMLVLGGDYVYHYQGDYNKIFQPFNRLDIKEKVAVSGNHDNQENHTAILKALKNNGFKVIDRKTLTLKKNDSSIEISGVPDFWDRYFSDTHLAKTTDSFRILLSHNPDYIVNTPAEFDLGLSGHTHGGQVTFFGLWSPVLPVRYKKYKSGHYSLEGRDLIITRGVGVVGVPFRFCAPSEISLITLKNSESK